MSSLEDRQHELQTRITQLDADIAACDANFAEPASAFNSIDSAASLKQAAALETKLSELRREKSLTLSAQAHVTKLQLHAKELEAQQARQSLLAEANKISNAICTLNNELDEQLVKLLQMFERRAALFHELAATNLIDSVAVNRLSGKGASTRACCAARLHSFISIEKTATQSFVTLASTNAVLLSIGKEPPAAVKTNGSAPPVPRGKIYGAEADEVPDA
jgi:hypothetical protein